MGRGEHLFELAFEFLNRSLGFFSPFPFGSSGHCGVGSGHVEASALGSSPVNTDLQGSE